MVKWGVIRGRRAKKIKEKIGKWKHVTDMTKQKY